MRRRLLASSLGIALAAVLVLGVPLGVVASRLVHREASARVDAEAQRVAAALEADLEGRRLPSPARLAELVPAGHAVELVDGRGRHVRTGGNPADALRSRTPAADGASVLVSAPRADADRRARDIWLAIGLLSLAGLLAALALGWVQSRLLSRPLEQLAAATHRLGSGDLGTRAGAHPLPEIQALAAALDRSAERLAEMVERERAFSANVSHQLRTPLTAMRLRLEALEAGAADAEVRSELAAALAQVDRLEATVASLLELARRGRAGHAEALDAASAVSDRAAAWRRTFAERGRELTLEAPGPATVQLAPGALEQALDVLLENSLVHGEGTTELALGTAERHVSVTVRDEGRVAEEVRDGGIGLALARGLIEADGGRLRLATARPAAFELLLPRAFAEP